MWLWSRRRAKQNDSDIEGGSNEREKSSNSAQKPKDVERKSTLDDVHELDEYIEDPDSTQAQAKGWKEAHERFKKLDEVTMREYSEEVDAVLVFAGLFSAILTAFIVEVYKGLQDDPAESSVQLLRRISIQLTNNTDDLSPLPATAPNPSATIVVVNMLWFSSLILGLFAALIGILVKQWLHVYSKWPEREQPKDTVILRYVYQEGFFRWHVPEIIGMLPVLLQIALLLFVIGLVAYMWTLNRIIAAVLTALVIIMIMAAIVTITLPLFADDCPYKSPIGLVLAVLKAKYVDGAPASDLSSWQRWDLSKAKPYLEKGLANDVVVQSGLILDLAPRVDLESALGKITNTNTLLGSRISSLPDEMTRLLFNLVVTSTQSKSGVEIDIKHMTYAVHVLEYMSRALKGDIRRNAAEAVVGIVTKLGNQLESGLEIVWSMVLRDANEKQNHVITRIPWQCALSIHEWGLANDPESEHTIRTCLYSMGVAAETVSRCSDYELEQIVESGSYDRLLDGLQFWIELACKREDVNAELTIREEQYGKLWERHRAKLSKLLLLGGHTSSITSISFSADGLRLVSGSRDKTVRVWDLKTGENVAILQGHTWYVNSVAFSADGSRVISGSDDNTVRVWDLQTRGKVTVFQGHSMPITSVAFSADGSRVVSGSSDSTVRVWDSQTGGNIAVLQGHTDWVNSVVFSADGSRVISGSDDKTVRVWDSQTGENVAVLQGHTDWVNSVAFSTDGSCIVSGSSDNSVRVWDSQTGENVAIFEDHTDSVTSVAFLSDGLHIISHDKNGNPHSWGSKTYLPSCPLPTSTISSSHSPLEFIFHSGWLLCKRANDNCAYRLHPVAENLVPSIPIKLFGSLFAYGTNETIIIVNFSRYTEYIGHISSV